MLLFVKINKLKKNVNLFSVWIDNVKPSEYNKHHSSGSFTYRLKLPEQNGMEDPKVKKYLALLLALVMVFALAACGSTAETPAPATEAPAAEPETPAEPAEADPM